MGFLLPVFVVTAMSLSAQRYQRHHQPNNRDAETKARTLTRKARRRAKSALMFLCLAFPAEPSF